MRTGINTRNKIDMLNQTVMHDSVEKPAPGHVRNFTDMRDMSDAMRIINNQSNSRDPSPSDVNIIKPKVFRAGGRNSELNTIDFKLDQQTYAKTPKAGHSISLKQTKEVPIKFSNRRNLQTIINKIGDAKNMSTQNSSN